MHEELGRADQNRSHRAFLGTPGPSQAPRNLGVPGLRDHNTGEAYIDEYLTHYYLKDDTEGLMKCNIQASHENNLSESALKFVRARLECKLRNESSSSVWIRMLRAYCRHVASTNEKSLEDTFIMALRCNWEMIRKLNDSKAFGQLKADSNFAPVLVSLLMAFLSKLDWENDDISLL
ncbi:MAG: hypothetical protein L6R38_002970 [Xanthoria sp. 2 TBL-2021]|nr:MAG: hypothetical protein L6R38_002970 [Xanthoria sp. 2 TBL-2021]